MDQQIFFKSLFVFFVSLIFGIFVTAITVLAEQFSYLVYVLPIGFGIPPILFAATFVYESKKLASCVQNGEKSEVSK